jgi:ribosome biogenesis SPOUT family RNA methylase Rps3
MRIIIEHLEPEMHEWYKIEYERISKLIGEENLTITNTKENLEFCNTEEKSIKEMKQNNACILDPEAKEKLTPETAKKHNTFILGGILGDNPPKDRTKTELTKYLPYESYNLGKEQMSTDTAAQVTKMIYEGKPLEKMKFVQGVEIEVEDGISVTLPYKYLIKENQLQIDPRIIELAKND